MTNQKVKFRNSYFRVTKKESKLFHSLWSLCCRTTVKAAEAATLAVDQPNVPHSKECALRWGINRSVGILATGQLTCHRLRNAEA